MRITLLYLVLALAWSNARAKCERVQFDVPSSFDKAPVRLVLEEFTAGEQGTTARLQLRSAGALAVERVLAVMQLSAKEKYLYSLVVEATTKDQPNLMPFPRSRDIPSFYEMDKSLLPGTSTRVEASTGETSSLCPDQMTLTFLEVHFAGSKTPYEHALPSWQIGAGLNRAEPWSFDEFNDDTRPYTALVRLRIDDAGIATLVEAAEQEESAKKLSWLSNEIHNKWLFLPARYHGDPITSDKWMLVMLFNHSSSPNRELASLISRSHVLTYSVLEIRRSSDRLHVLYGSDELPVPYRSDRKSER